LIEIGSRLIVMHELIFDEAQLDSHSAGRAGTPEKLAVLLS
jgi:hypothetical protein